jgi:RNA polymerase sigma-70 factor (ECF subfamily)
MRIDDKQALISQWYDRYAQDIFSIIYLMTGDYQQAEDLTQETFMRAFKHVETYREESHPKTWLIKIGRHLAIDYLRKKKPMHMIMEMLINKPSDDRLPVDLVALNESKQELFNALLTLPRKYREIIILRKVKGFSTKETADILGWSESKVKVTLHRAMDDLKKRLEERGYAHGAI